MSGIHGMFVQSSGESPEATIALLRSVARRSPEVRRFWEVAFDDSLPWVRLHSAAVDQLEALARVISARAGRTVVALDCPGNVEAIAYYHFAGGNLCRALVAGGGQEGVWDKAAGMAEPWEADTWLRLQPAAAGTAHKEALSTLASRIIGFHRLPAAGLRCRRFGPIWPLRLLGLFWSRA